MNDTQIRWDKLPILTKIAFLNFGNTVIFRLEEKTKTKNNARIPYPEILM